MFEGSPTVLRLSRADTFCLDVGFALTPFDPVNTWMRWSVAPPGAFKRSWLRWGGLETGSGPGALRGSAAAVAGASGARRRQAARGKGEAWSLLRSIHTALSLLTDPRGASLAFPISGRERNPHLGTSSCESHSRFSVECRVNGPQSWRPWPLGRQCAPAGSRRRAAATCTASCVGLSPLRDIAASQGLSLIHI